MKLDLDFLDKSLNGGLPKLRATCLILIEKYKSPSHKEHYTKIIAAIDARSLERSKKIAPTQQTLQDTPKD